MNSARRMVLLSCGMLLLTAVQGCAQSFTCSSDDGRRHYCRVNGRGGVQLVKQRSGSPCTEGYSWGQDSRGVWVDRGCRADFIARRPVGPGGRPPGLGGRPPISGPAQTVSCSSDDGRRNVCPVDTRGGVQLARQRSESPCRQGYSWGFNRQGIWVDRGCRAEFLVGQAGYRR